ncbi:MAG: helix-turn-helix transcriptional regulator [Spirochaetia bacterium]|nr:helix-turn-helix transcriptional regulator [Spirochaetia bacterium]
MHFLRKTQTPGRTYVNFDDPLLAVLFNEVQPKILRHGRVFANRSWGFHPVRPAFHRLYLVTQGEGWIRFAQKNQTRLQKNHIYLFPAYCSFEVGCQKRMEFFYIQFQMEWSSGFDPLADVRPPAGYRHRGSPSLQQIVARFGTERLGDWLYLKGFLCEALSVFADRPRSDLAEHQRKTGTYRALFETIDRTPYSDIRVGALAAGLGLAPHQLAYAFKRDMGHSLREHINRVFLAKARERILSGGKKMREIARDLGFQNELYFSRFFRREQRESPRGFLNRNRLQEERG